MELQCHVNSKSDSCCASRLKTAESQLQVKSNCHTRLKIHLPKSAKVIILVNRIRKISSWLLMVMCYSELQFNDRVGWHLMETANQIICYRNVSCLQKGTSRLMRWPRLRKLIRGSRVKQQAQLGLTQVQTHRESMTPYMFPISRGPTPR